MDLNGIKYIEDINRDSLLNIMEKLIEKFPYLKEADWRISGSMCWKINRNPNDIDIVFSVPEKYISYIEVFSETNVGHLIKDYIEKNKLITGLRVDILLLIKERFEKRKIYLEKNLPIMYNKIKNYPEYDFKNNIAHNFIMGTPVIPTPNKHLCNSLLSPSIVNYELYK